MKILAITPNIPFPLSEGGKVAQFTILDEIRYHVEVTLILFCNSDGEMTDIEQLIVKWPNVNIIVKDQRTSEVKSFSNRLRNLYRKYKHAPVNTSSTEKKSLAYTKYLNELEESKYLHTMKSNGVVNFICDCVDKVKPDIVQIDLLAFIDLVHAIPPNYKKVFVHHELRYERIHTLLQVQHKVSAYEHYIYEHIKCIELSLLDDFDGVIVYSNDDKKKLEQTLKRSNILSNGFPVPNDSFKEIIKDDLIINKLVFLGGEGHYPNVDAIEWYLSDIAPIIYPELNLCLHVIGKWTEATISSKSKDGLIKFVGFVDDLYSYCKNSIMIVPVRLGSGIRTKILYAMAQGTPVVTATIGCEGISGRDTEDFLIADEPEAYLSSIQKIVSNLNFAYTMVNNAQNTAQKYYSQKTAASVRLKYFNDLIG